MARKKDKGKLNAPELMLTTGTGSDLDLYCNVLNPDCLRGEAVEGVPENILQHLLDVQKEIGRLTHAWFASGSDVQRLFKMDPALGGAISNFPLYLTPTGNGKAWLRPFSLNPEHRSDSKEIALGHFIHFLLNPLNHKLAGPCRKCGRYYLKKTKRQTSYCSTACGRKFTALVAQNAQAKRERLNKIQRAQNSLLRWAKTSRRQTWIEFVHRTTGVSKAFLTRSMNQGDLVVPKQVPITTTQGTEMESIWKVVAEILVEPGDLLSGSTEAFANIVTWAGSAPIAEEKIARYLGSYKWQFLSTEDARVVDADHDYGDDINEMIEKAQGNPQAIILGRFFSYKEN